MNENLIQKYKSYPTVNLPNRNWPNQTITKAPIWCSVDLRDGNQALIQPMRLSEKIELFNLLVKIGFKQIEVGFPSASETEYNFLKEIINKKLIPDDVTIQVLSQAREHLILKTFEALEGAKKVIFHIYNSTSTVQRKVVFQKTKSEIKDLALEGIRKIKSLISKTKAEIILEYSPESFTGTELDFSLEICEAVINEWKLNYPIILNLPATVELSTPNIYADQIEWFIKNIKNRKNIIISVHNHNDRGTAVAATELALMAGADRVEGTLFGNGERTGNVDILTLALNLYTQGINPNLDFHNLNEIVDICEKCTKIPISVRHPYAGDLVYTAFSGSHQDAINKGMKYYSKNRQKIWEVPYLAIDPSDLGRTYESIIRINSQSGKGGVSYVLNKQFGFEIPKKMQSQISNVVQEVADRTGEEINSRQVLEIFKNSFFDLKTPLEYLSSEITKTEDDNTNCVLNITFNKKKFKLEGVGDGPLAASIYALNKTEIGKYGLNINSYYEHALQKNTNAEAVSYVEITNKKIFCWGCGLSKSITTASIKSLFSAINRFLSFQHVLSE